MFFLFGFECFPPAHREFPVLYSIQYVCTTLVRGIASAMLCFRPNRLHCDDMATAAGGTDRTGYGTSRTATTNFFTHHLRVLSIAVAWGVGEAISRTFVLTRRAQAQGGVVATDRSRV